MKKIVLTGGGTAGHVTPNLALVDKLKENDYDIVYIGRKEEGKFIIEKDLCKNEGIPYFGISSGKLRRYFSVENAKDALRVLKGTSDALVLLKKIKPDIVFSKGGFVTAPVIFASKLLKIPVIIHESDLTPGLANKISIPSAKVVLTSFAETLEYLPKDKGIVTGPPIRMDLFTGSYQKGKELCNFKYNKPVILVIGGSSGAKKINEIIVSSLDNITNKYNVIHICGKDNKNNVTNDSYIAIEYLKEDLKHALAYADLVISRAGSNSIFEFLALNKPNILIPLPKGQSRGDQIQNANVFYDKGYSLILEEEYLTENLLLSNIDNLYENKDKFIDNMMKSDFTNGIDKIIEQIIKYTKWNSKRLRHLEP